MHLLHRAQTLEAAEAGALTSADGRPSPGPRVNGLQPTEQPRHGRPADTAAPCASAETEKAEQDHAEPRSRRKEPGEARGPRSLRPWMASSGADGQTDLPRTAQDTFVGGVTRQSHVNACFPILTVEAYRDHR